MGAALTDFIFLQPWQVPVWHLRVVWRVSDDVLLHKQEGCRLMTSELASEDTRMVEGWGKKASDRT